MTAAELRALVEAVRDAEDVDAALRLADALLAAPEVMEAYEAVCELGRAKAHERKLSENWRDGKAAYLERCGAEDHRIAAHRAVEALADRIGGGDADR